LRLSEQSRTTDATELRQSGRAKRGIALKGGHRRPRRKLTRMHEGSKEQKQNEAGFKVVRAAKGALEVQLNFATGKTGKRSAKAIDDFSRGYVAGFIDAMMQNININDEAESFAFVTILFMELFGQEESVSLASHFIDTQHLPNTRQGMMAGGTDGLAWLKSAKATPLGWYRYLQ